MSTTDVETILERRRLSRRLTFWRVLAVLAAALALIAVVWQLAGGPGGGLSAGKHIARITISGLILEDRKMTDLLKEVGEASNVAGVLLSVDSPGGTTTGGEALYEAIADLATKKPVAAVCGTMATSAAYMISLASDHIVTRGNTITGSVGVIFQFPEVSGALGKLGITMYEIKSGPLKANPSMFQPLDEAGRALAEEMVKESQVWFLGLVTKRRGITAASVPGLEAGRIYSGRQALQHRLIDAIGGEAEAIDWMVEKRNVAKGLQVIDWKPKQEGALAWLGGPGSLAERLLGAGGAGALGELVPAAWRDRLELDGLLSIWQAP